jgi:L,D-transpeptidase ErfK/SrfK
VSRGCIRLYPEDIPRLYRMVAVGTPVKIVREPVKVGARGRRVFVEVHDELVAREDDRGPGGAREDADGALGGAPGAPSPADRAGEARELLRQRALLESVDEAKVMVAAAEKRGVPVDVTR